MFLPFSVEHSFQRVAYVTIGLGAIMILVALFSGLPGGAVEAGYALDPSAFHVRQLITSGFIHGGIMHLLGNLLFLWVFGRYVEDRLGATKFLALYFASEVGADVAQLAFGRSGPSIGASGAISGLMGYVLVAAPWLEVRCALVIGFYATRGFDVAAGFLLIPWVLMQLVEASYGSMDGVAVAAHIGGFLFGVAAAAVMRSRYCHGTGWYIDPLPPKGGQAAVDRLRNARARGR